MGSRPVLLPSPPKTCYKQMEMRTARKIIENQEKNDKDLTIELKNLCNDRDFALREIYTSRLLFCRQQASKFHLRNISQGQVKLLRSSCSDIQSIVNSSQQNRLVPRDSQQKRRNTSHPSDTRGTDSTQLQVHRSYTDSAIGQSYRDCPSTNHSMLTLKSERSMTLSRNSLSSLQHYSCNRSGFKPPEKTLAEEQQLETGFSTSKTQPVLTSRSVPLRSVHMLLNGDSDTVRSGVMKLGPQSALRVSEKDNKSLHLTKHLGGPSHFRKQRHTFSGEKTVSLSTENVNKISCIESENKNTKFRTVLNFSTPRSFRFNPPPSLRGKKTTK